MNIDHKRTIFKPDVSKKKKKMMIHVYSADLVLLTENKNFTMLKKKKWFWFKNELTDILAIFYLL